MKFLAIPFFASCLAVGSMAWADWSDYHLSSLSEIFSEHASCNNPPVDFHLESGNWKYKIRVTSHAKTRIITSNSLKFVTRWAKSLGHPPATAALFTHEVSVSDGVNEYWLPMQQSLVHAFQDEVEIGDRVELSVLLAGALEDRWILLVNEFRRLSPSDPAV